MDIIRPILLRLMKIFSIIPRPKKRKTGADTSEERKRLVDQEENTSERKKSDIPAIGVMKQLIELRNKMNELENDVFTKIYITELEKVEKRLDEQESRLEDLKQSVEEKEESVVPYETPAAETLKEDEGASETVRSFTIKNLPETAEIPMKESEIEESKNIIKKWQKIADELKSIMKDIPEKNALENLRLTTKIAKLFAEEKIKPVSSPVQIINGEMTFKAFIDKVISEASVPRELLDKIRQELRNDLKPMKVILEYQRGINLLKKKAYEEAKECFEEITTVKPDLKGAWLNSGVALGELGDIDLEIACYSTALEIDKGYKKAKHNKRIAEKKRKKLSKGCVK